MKSKTSVLLPVYNSEKTIDRCLSSIYNQTIDVDEVVIVNDGCTDNTEIKILNWQNKLPIIYLKNTKNMGIPYSLRKGIKNSSGQIIMRIDSDDQWREIHNEEILKLSRNDEASIYATRSQYISENLTPIYVSKSISDLSVRRDLMWDNPFVHSSIAFKKSKYFLTKGYGGHKITQDYHLIIELLNQGKLEYSKKITVNYFVNKNSISRLYLKSALRGRFIGQIKAIYYFWKKYPLNALRILLILIIRILVGR